MRTDIILANLRAELASLRALGDVCRRQSLDDRLLRERREASSASERIRVWRQRANLPHASASGNEP